MSFQPQPDPQSGSQSDTPATGDAGLDSVEDNLTDAVQQGQTSLQELAGWFQDDRAGFTLAAGIALAILFGGLALKWLICVARDRMSETSRLRVLLGIADRIAALVLLLVGSAIGADFAGAPDVLRRSLWYLASFALIIQIAAVIRGVLVDWVRMRASRRADARGAIWNGVAIIRWAIGVLVWSIALLLILDNVGIDVTALIAGLGIGGIAIGLAAQDLFKDLFAGLAILFDKPFKRGDFIIFGDYLGEVESIGLKTTRIRALSGEQVVIQNSNLLDETIRNYQRLYRRRWNWEFGVTYQTPPDKVDAIAGWVKEIIEATDNVEFDRAHFAGFGDSALVFEIVGHITDADYAVYMDVRHAVNMALMRKFADEGVDFAYPTRTLMLGRPDGSTFDPAEQSRNGGATQNAPARDGSTGPASAAAPDNGARADDADTHD